MSTKKLKHTLKRKSLTHKENYHDLSSLIDKNVISDYQTQNDRKQYMKSIKNCLT